MYLNRAIIIGNLTRDPEKKALPSGIAVTSFAVATNRVYKDKNGARQESTDYHNVVVFGKQAESAAQYLKKGSNVLVEGRMQTRSWDDKASGEKKYRTEVIADRVQFGNRPGGPGAPTTGATSAPTGAKATKDEAPLDTIEYPSEEINAEDIPF